MRALDRVVEGADRRQRRSVPLGFLFAVNKKFGDDRGGMLAGLMAYYGFLSLFPLLLLLITVVGLVSGGDPSTVHRVEHSALSQFPVIGAHLGNNIHSLHDRAGIGLIVGILGLIWGSQGAAQAGMFAMAQIWYVPMVERPGFVPRLLRYLAIVSVVGVFVLVSTALAGVATVGNRGALEVVAAVVLSLLANVGVYVLAFRLLTPGAVAWGCLLPGAVLGGVGWTILQYVGGTLVDHTLRNTSQVYGFFAIVLGLLAWIYLGAQLTMYAAEVNVVLLRRLWPRGIRAPFTDADREVLTGLVLQQRSRPGQLVEVRFEGEDGADGVHRAGAADATGTGGGRSDPVGAAPPADGGPSRPDDAAPVHSRR